MLDLPKKAATVSTGLLDVLIIGAGFSGLAMAIRLKQAGMNSFLILEKGDDIGGTWRDNTYPGAASDIPSHLYSLSFEPKADWSNMYPQQPEVQAYLRDVANRHALHRRLRLATAVREARWDASHSLWRVTTSKGETIAARVLVSGMGALHHPRYPQLPGLASFAGRTFHSSQWDHRYDLAGKRVAVIGTGASAIQFVPQIAPLVGKLYLFQRTAPWILPKLDRPISARERLTFRLLPLYRRLFRNWLFWMHEVRVLGFLRIVSKLTEVAAKMASDHLAEQVEDPELRRKLTPDYALGCKRVLISNDYYPTLARPNVELVTDAIAEVRPGAIVTQDGVERPVDALIYGTGFAISDAISRVRVVGRGGVELKEAWRNGMEAYKGIAVSGFPNFFILLGPNTALGHNSVVIMIEAQVRYIMSCLRQMRRRGLATVEVKSEVQRGFVERVQARLSRTVWQTGGCRSWYQDENGRNVAIWPASVVEYCLRTRRAALADYLIDAAGASEQLADAA